MASEEPEPTLPNASEQDQDLEPANENAPVEGQETEQETEPTGENGGEEQEEEEEMMPALDSDDEDEELAIENNEPDLEDTEERQEMEEQQMMAQAATAAVAEHLRAEQSMDEPVLLTEIQDQPGAVSRGGGGTRFPCLTPNRAHIARLPSPRGNRSQHSSRLHILTRGISAKMVKMSKVSMSARARVNTSHGSNYVLTPRRPQKVITLDQALSARPPLRVDMEGPTPCTYTPATKPLQETNSPHWSFGQRNFIERSGGARTSWEKTWFQTPHVWHNKADFNGEADWPTPSQYHSLPAMGPHHPVAKAGFSHSIGIRRAMTINKKGSETEPAPNEYNQNVSELTSRKRAPAYSHSFRREGTILWSVGESYDNPGPGSYNPKGSFIQPHKPAFTIQGIRREKSHYLGPYATF